MKLRIIATGIVILSFMAFSQMEVQNEEFNYTVEAAPEWDALFKRSSGWFGGDGIFAIPRSGIDYQEVEDSTENMILFSDTMVGEIEEGELKDGFTMVNNSIAYLQGRVPKEENITFHVDEDSEGKPTSLFPMKLKSAEEGEYYWLGDGFVNPSNQHTYVFAYRVVNKPEYPVFGFDILGGAIIKLHSDDRFPFRRQEQMEFPFFYPIKPQVMGSYGAGILVNTESSRVPNPDGYIYVYGVRDPGKELLVSRVKPSKFENFKAWKFWNGKKWVSDYNAAVPVTDKVSNELSVSPLPNGKYVLICTAGGVEPAVHMRVGDSPIGPFGPIISIWDCSEAIEEPEFFAYNAKAHPSLSQPGELLISYNVNSFKFWDQVRDYPNLYRPRFFKLKY